MNSLGFNKLEKDTKVVVAMSGGVDSSVAAVNLKKEGYDIIGITLKLYNHQNISKSKTCCAGKDIADAEKVAKQYNFPHLTLDYQDKFFDGVINKFINSYANAETPVPCIDCNQTVKFKDLLNEAKKIGADALVTGHYAIREGNKSNARLFKAKDQKKDQSYFLFATLQNQLNYVRFPLGNFLKQEIRRLAKSYNLEISEKPDSQDICFVTSDSYRELINKLQPEINSEGDIFDYNNNFLGRHKGIANYTIGQRKGIGISGAGEPLYVVDINKAKNSIILGPLEKLKKTKINFKQVNWIGGNIKPINLKCHAKIRSTQKELPGKLNIFDQDGFFVFDEYIDSTSPGQACVFYKNNQVLGGGWITK
tara:strand:- start:22188 stop:23282 length:1095 start_codon:yes stop_codon:yes gene_type:complete